MFFRYSLYIYICFKFEVNNLCSHPRVVDITKRKPGLEPASQSVDPIKELIARTTLLTLLEKKMQELQANITTVQAANRPGGQVRADFSTFPTPQFAKMLHEKSGDSMLVAKICIPVKGCHGERCTHTCDIRSITENTFIIHMISDYM
ncbi:dynactin subunit 1-like [Mytilus edulis]|uniref:dynactin subunit 1-like n=1 Tax=Mytilus edulis TaxID=6550 RepID=UPI0039EDF8F6